MNDLHLRASDADVRVMSSNILFAKDLPDRIPLLAAYFRAVGADVIGVQEVNRIGLGLVEAVADIYTPVATAFADGKHCYTPILYRADKYALLEGDASLYASRGTDTKSMSWAVLADRVSGKRFAVINSHGSLILAHYGLDATDEGLGEQWRCDNVREILAKKDELRAKYGAALPVFVTGDFNAYPDRPSVLAMKAVMPDAAAVATVSHTDGFSSYHDVPGRACPAGAPIASSSSPTTQWRC